MPVRLRPLNLNSDRVEVISTLRRLLHPEFDDRRFDWLYLGSPFGAARAWVACDVEKGAIVGCAAAFPRKVCFDGDEKMGLVLGDFCLDPEFRSLGPALQLQRACLEAASQPPYAFCYDFPSPSMMAVYQRLGVPQCGSLVRWAKPLRTKGKLEPLIGSNPVARGVTCVADMALSLRGWKGSGRACDIALHEGAFGEEFSELDGKLRSQPGVRALRSADFLNWRYHSYPGKNHEIITARRAGTLVGCVVFTKDEEDTSIVDLSSVEEPHVIARLLAAAVERLRHHGAATISMNAADKHPWNAIFHRAGFRPREESPVVVCMSPGGTQSLADFQQSWYLMRGERDS
jgi:GNAT superfamily N-acetyltransferase